MEKSYKKQFTSPRVLQEVELRLERNFLGSVVDTGLSVETTGQEVVDMDFSPDNNEGFNFKWEE
ncbi:MAG: hypothetical protein IJ721_09480 [Bacteroidales bacterium]|nr:hypothetical protein [Bacteroidales bacterium]